MDPRAKPHQRPDTGAATKRSWTSTSRATGLCVLIELSDKQLIPGQRPLLDSGDPSKPTGKTLGGQGLPLKKRHRVHRAGNRVRLAGAQGASSSTSSMCPCWSPPPSCNRCATQKRVDIVNVPVPPSCNRSPGTREASRTPCSQKPIPDRPTRRWTDGTP